MEPQRTQPAVDGQPTSTAQRQAASTADRIAQSTADRREQSASNRDTRSTTERGSQSTGNRRGQSTTEQPASTSDDPALSVVVVTYNEVDRIRDCLESILEACSAVPSAEVILVDSNSADGTVEAACEYPITVLQIPDDDLTTPGAGRYVGEHAASGDRILFVDGDIELTEGWLEDALALLEDRDDVAGVDGHLNESGRAHVTSVDMCHGVALYEADALATVGGFDPHLRALEDIELGIRLRTAGYRLLRLPDVVGRHPVSSGASEVARRWQNGYYYGLGQVTRKSARSARTLAAVLSRYRYPLLFQCWLGLGAITAVLGLPVLAAWLVCSAVLFLADAAWEGRADATQRVVEYSVMPLGFLRGAFLAPRDPEEYPVEATVTVKEHGGAIEDAATPAES